MLKVCFLVNTLDSGGLENYLLRFLRFKYSSFTQVTVICKGKKGGQLEMEYLKIPNVSIKIMQIGFYNPLDYLKLGAFLKTNEFHSVCDFTGNFAGPVLLISKLVGIKKRVVFYRGASDHFSGSYFKEIYNHLVKNLTFKVATDILSNSRAAFNYFFKDYRIDGRFKVIYNGINVEDFDVGNKTLREELKIPANAFVVGHTGRFDPAKNHSAIIEVARVLCNRYQDIYFILCGNGVKTNLEAVIESEHLSQRVLLFENRRDIPVFLNTMDAYFFPSLTEGQPNALIEAMIMGLPFVASDIEPIKETVGESLYQNLCPPDNISGYVNLIEHLYIDGRGRDFVNKNLIKDRFNHEVLFELFYETLNK